MQSLERYSVRRPCGTDGDGKKTRGMGFCPSCKISETEDPPTERNVASAGAVQRNDLPLHLREYEVV